MESIVLPEIGTATAWRGAARGLIARGVPPEAVRWSCGADAGDLFAATPTASAQPAAAFTVPKSFLGMADDALWHNDPERFARLYHLLWRLRDAPRLMADRADGDVARLQAMAKHVRRCKHKMKAFVRFREIGDPDTPRRSFAAWFEPTHHTVEPTAPFFARRFADMDWRIVTPCRTAIFEGGKLSFAPGQPRPPLPEDATEELWTTYFRSIFNPARLMVSAMQSEMPRKYWKNMPEARAIPGLIAGAEARVREMAQAAPTLAPAHARNARAQAQSHVSAWETAPDGLTAAIHACTRCPLHAMATQAVPGEGPLDARLMMVGEQPGDREDLSGRPFVGPAGQLLDEGLAAAGIDRATVFLTNAVKHFKFTPRGKRRLHQRPDAGEIETCSWWLRREEQTVDPRLIVALGATAAEALTGSGKHLLKRRGGIEETRQGRPVFLTIHPSFLLRIPDPVRRAEERARFFDDLATVARHAA